MLRGATQQILDEAERSLHDALCVLAQTVKEPRTVYGGGCSEMLMAKVVTDLANRTPGKEAVAMESFAKALRMVRGGFFYLFIGYRSIFIHIYLFSFVPRHVSVTLLFSSAAPDHHRRQRRLRQRRPGGPAQSRAPGEQNHVRAE